MASNIIVYCCCMFILPCNYHRNQNIRIMGMFSFPHICLFHGSLIVQNTNKEIGKSKSIRNMEQIVIPYNY